MCALWQPTGTTEYALVGDGSTMDLLAGNDPVSELLLETKSPEGLWLRDASSSSAAGEGDGEDEPGPVDEATREHCSTATCAAHPSGDVALHTATRR